LAPTGGAGSGQQQDSGLALARAARKNSGTNEKAPGREWRGIRMALKATKNDFLHQPQSGMRFSRRVKKMLSRKPAWIVATQAVPERIKFLKGEVRVDAIAADFARNFHRAADEMAVDFDIEQCGSGHLRGLQERIHDRYNITA
jgi:hypothetical protein